jgi:hypothetical protein
MKRRTVLLLCALLLGGPAWAQFDHAYSMLLSR